MFNAVIPVSVPDEPAVWDATARLMASTARVFERMRGTSSGLDFALFDEAGTKIERDSIAGVRAAAREYRIKPDRLTGTVYFTPEGAKAWDAGLQVRVQVTFWTSPADAIVVRIAGEDKIQVDGLEAHLLREVEHLGEPDPIPVSDAASVAASSHTAPSQSNVFHGPVNVGVIGNGGSVGSIGNVGSAESAPSSEPERGFWAWLRRTWLDHTAALAVTIAGTVAAAFVAIWIGLNPV